MLKQNIFRLRCVGWEKKGKRKREKFKGVMGSFYPLTWNRGGAGGGGERVGGWVWWGVGEDVWWGRLHYFHSVCRPLAKTSPVVKTEGIYNILNPILSL